LACKEKLYKWTIKDSEICERCNVEIDSIEHHLVACTKILPFWNSLFKWWKTNMEMNFPIDTYDILLGIMNLNDDTVINQLNYIIIHALYYVYRCNIKEENKELYRFLIELKNTMQYMEINMLSENMEEKFQKLWGELYECI
jgi:uncharacterized protein involved in tolerance to divalent cations